MYFHVYLIYRFTRTFTDHSSVITRCWGFELQNGKSSLKSPQTLATQGFAPASFLSTPDMKSTCFGKCSFRYPSGQRTADPGAERPIPSRQLGCQPMGRAAGSSNLPNSSMKGTCFGKCFFRFRRRKAGPLLLRQRALLIPPAGGPYRICGKAALLFCREAALTFLCGQRPRFLKQRFQTLIIPRRGRGTREPTLRVGDGRPHHLFFTKRDGAA